MESDVDTLLAEIMSLSSTLSCLSPDDPARKRLETKRDTLRETAATMAMGGRHPQSVEREIETIEARLAEIESMFITEGYQERRGGKNLQDPGAYSANINQLLDQQHADEINTLTEQLALLRLHPAPSDTP